MLIKSIDEYLASRPEQGRRKHCFHPSSLHKSAKELYHYYLNGDSDQDFEPRIIRIFDNGQDVHKRIHNYLKKVGVLLQTEVPIRNEEYEISGHMDGIIKINGVEGVLEIKSMNSTQFHSCLEPKPEHLIQINAYMFCSGIPRGCLLYECKDNQDLKEFYVKQDKIILDAILEKIRYVQASIKEGKEPR